MRALIKNLGPLHEADLDLSKPLIILTGPNNSGKTYLAWSLYGIISGHGWGGASRKQLVAGQNLASALLDGPEQGVEGHVFASHAAVLVQDIANAFLEKIDRFFAAPSGLFSSTGITLTPSASDIAHWSQGGVLDLEIFLKGFSLSFRTGSGNVALAVKRAHEPAPGSPSAAARFDVPSTRDLTQEERNSIKGPIASILPMAVWNDLFGQSWLFPAERIAVNIFAKELAVKRTELVDQALERGRELRGTIEREASWYQAPIRENIWMANSLSGLRTNTSNFQDLADELEDIAGGKFDVGEAGDLGFTPNGVQSPRLAFHLTSSLIKSLASLAFYFRHRALPRTTVVIDEPELNLHPDLQRRVARFIAKVVQRGIRVIITTHSDYIIRELSNLVRLGERGGEGESLAKNLGYDPTSLLRANNVGAWFLDQGTAKELPVDAEGFTAPTIDKAIESQNKDTQTISFGLPD